MKQTIVTIVILAIVFLTGCKCGCQNEPSALKIDGNTAKKVCAVALSSDKG